MRPVSFAHYSTEQVEHARRLFAQNCEFLRGCLSLSDLPPPTLPEAAIAGRSNVGKSTLINLLTGRKNLARVSKTPGRTRELNFFRAGHELMLADLPGYGYARVSRAETARWTELIFAYLGGRPNLRRVFLLIDSRRGPLPNDIWAMELLDRAAVSFQAVMTKCDKPGKSELRHVLAQSEAEVRKHPAALPEVLMVSALTREGIDELRAAIAALAVR
jgi:GTP-binding protein